MGKELMSALLGAIVGGIITGFISLYLLEQQIDASSTQVQKQLRYQAFSQFILKYGDATQVIRNSKDTHMGYWYELYNYMRLMEIVGAGNVSEAIEIMRRDAHPRNLDYNATKIKKGYYPALKKITVEMKKSLGIANHNGSDVQETVEMKKSLGIANHNGSDVQERYF